MAKGLPRHVSEALVSTLSKGGACLINNNSYQSHYITKCDQRQNIRAEGRVAWDARSRDYEPAVLHRVHRSAYLRHTVLIGTPTLQQRLLDDRMSGNSSY